MYTQLIETCHNIFQTLRSFALLLVEKITTPIGDIIDDTGVIGWIGELLIPDNILNAPVYVALFGIGIGYVLLLSAKKLIKG